MAIWLYGVMFRALARAADRDPVRRGLRGRSTAAGAQVSLAMDLCIGGAIGLVAGLIRGAFAAAVCHPIPGDVFVPASLTPLWYCSISSALLGAACAPSVLCVRTARVAEASATGTWKEPSAAPHHDL